MDYLNKIPESFETALGGINEIRFDLEDYQIIYLRSRLRLFMEKIDDHKCFLDVSKVFIKGTQYFLDGVKTKILDDNDACTKIKDSDEKLESVLPGIDSLKEKTDQNADHPILDHVVFVVADEVRKKIAEFLKIFTANSEAFDENKIDDYFRNFL
ncbi:hypothetical protein GF366_00050 [Candidatus Peregrinibacteria bacterium]|nr:hypothetical protein [Candidatus Peregrinibacteria bacterium]